MCGFYFIHLVHLGERWGVSLTFRAYITLQTHLLMLLFFFGCSTASLLTASCTPKTSRAAIRRYVFSPMYAPILLLHKNHHTFWSTHDFAHENQENEQWTMLAVNELGATTEQNIFHLFYNCERVQEWCIVMFTCAGWSVIVLILVVLPPLPLLKVQLLCFASPFFFEIEKCCFCG